MFGRAKSASGCSSGIQTTIDNCSSVEFQPLLQQKPCMLLIPVLQRLEALALIQCKAFRQIGKGNPDFASRIHQDVPGRTKSLYLPTCRILNWRRRPWSRDGCGNRACSQLPGEDWCRHNFLTCGFLMGSAMLCYAVLLAQARSCTNIPWIQTCRVQPISCRLLSHGML